MIQVSSSARFVHVVVETPGACFCAAVHAHTERRQLWADLPTLQHPPGVLSIPDEELDLGTTLRDGDVVVESLSSATGGQHLQRGLLGLLLGIRGPTWLWAGALMFPLELSSGARSGYEVGYHRLWTPFGTLLGPAVGPGHVCPSALRDQLPAWGAFAPVDPPVAPADYERVPRSPDQALASIVLVSPPAPRVVLLPTRSQSAHILRTLQAVIPLCLRTLRSGEVLNIPLNLLYPCETGMLFMSRLIGGFPCSELRPQPDIPQWCTLLLSPFGACHLLLISLVCYSLGNTARSAPFACLL